MTLLPDDFCDALDSYLNFKQREKPTMTLHVGNTYALRKSVDAPRQKLVTITERNPLCKDSCFRGHYHNTQDYGRWYEDGSLNGPGSDPVGMDLVEINICQSCKKSQIEPDEPICAECDWAMARLHRHALDAPTPTPGGPMKALTICQPYAHLIMIKDKRVENRTWPTKYRGPLAIHAGKSRSWLGMGDETRWPLVFGAVVGTAQLVDCLTPEQVWAKYPELIDNEHVNGPWCFVLDSVVQFASPIPYKGEQGFFNIPDELLAAQ